MSYVIVPQSHPDSLAFYTQVKRIDNPGMNIVKVFECTHRHLDHMTASTCPEAFAARDVDRVARQSETDSGSST